MTSTLADLRRHLHARAEVGLHLPRTQETLLDALAGLDLEITRGADLSSVTAVLRGGRPGPVVLLRADMDALPITEATGLPFAAAGGTMHACGHDLHMAGLVGAARLLHARRDEMPGSVVFMFQPGEEGFAGARIMLAEGVLTAAGERPVAAYAVHMDCGTEAGVLATRPGPMMASSSVLTMRVHGSGGHAALPHLGTDPVPVAAEIVLALQSFVARRVPATEPVVLSVTRLATNSNASNVLPSAVDIDANVRTHARTALDLVRTEVPKLVTALGAAHGCRVDVRFTDSYPVTHNDPAETEAVMTALRGRHGAERVRLLAAPGMASEDFAYVLDEVPGTMLFLGARPEGVAEADAPPMHSERAVFDDGVLDFQAATLAGLAWRRLGAPGEVTG